MRRPRDVGLDGDRLIDSGPADHRDAATAEEIIAQSRLADDMRL